MHIFAVNVYFNYHFKEVGAEKFVSIIHPANLEDYSRVYFNEEDYFLWTEVAPPSASNYKAVEKLYDSISLSFDMG